MEKNKFNSLKSLGLTTTELLSKVVETYGYTITNKSYRDLGKDLGMSYENVRLHFQKMERAGFMKVERNNTRRGIFYLNKDNVNQLLQWLQTMNK